MKKSIFNTFLTLCLLTAIVPLFSKTIPFIPHSKHPISLFVSPYYSPYTKIAYPQINGINDPLIENRIYGIIDDTIFDFLRQQNISFYSSQYITYSIYYVTPSIISFSIENTQIMASSYTKKKFFTINLDSGNTLLISDFLGTNYSTIIKEQVTTQVLQNMQKDKNKLYFLDKIASLKIVEEQSFYINKDGKVVITFDKYQIAPGYMGLPEFSIK